MEKIWDSWEEAYWEVIKEIKEEVKTESGLLLSAEDTSNIRYKKGKVIAPGTDVSVIDSDDIIFYDSRAGYTLIIKEETYTVISERDVVVVL
jgi:co-chaperonin GroES (HSP10)